MCDDEEAVAIPRWISGTQFVKDTLSISELNESRDKLSLLKPHFYFSTLRESYLSEDKMGVSVEV